ncbi:uncharacterized protein Z520_11434 [Fonsecaea multimorphosa CBS 102226]|uniref:AB hydrolase-1 domain-containing protein n=1 Tax=Fonsecaea multimorphosa CBS 102226 TaxID=1442371 RepID=A0A0D2I6B7_9EURO|nr:uncharacterized protein Z520_11434 [Fonsecaea multimorphosa CBS 102226]KIX92771.1 hypothetical protein Z520_11434 [Fonsecaea multimorphosa CBS 102226]OAL18021.1 hypothetical protein AYO22_11037 [Fonsecaea multimorphosa]
MSSALETRHPTIRSADGTQIWAASAGRSAKDAPVIVFVPGFSSSSLTFRKQFQDESLLAKYCLITYEPRGQGRSGQPLEKAAYSSERNAEDFKAVCETFGATKVVLAGWSYGGIIPVDVFAHLGPDWISGIIYLSGLPWRSAHPEIGHPFAFEALGPLIQPDAAGIATSLEVVLDSCFYPPNRDTMTYTEHTALAGAIGQQHPVARTLLLTARDQDPTKLLDHATTMPVLLIIGEHDRQILWENVDALLKRHFVRYEVLLVKDAGHTAFWERPVETNVAIQAFVDEL